VRVLFGSIALFALALLPYTSTAQTDEVPFGLLPVNAGGAVVIDAAALGGRRSTGLGQALLRYQAGLICINARNSDARTVSLVHYTFTYYDPSGKRSSGDNFTRKGTFVSGERMLGFDAMTHGVHEENCSPVHYPKDGIGASVFFVDHVEFADGTAWDAPAVHLPDDVSSAFLPHVPVAPRTLAGPAVEVAPLVAGIVATCEQAQNLRMINVPMFNGAVSVQYDSSRNVVTDGQTICRSSSDGQRDAVAQALVAKPPYSTVRRTFLVYFPFIDAKPTCTEPPRMMWSGSFAIPPPANINDFPVPGVYVATVAVDVDAGGIPQQATIQTPSGLPQLDTAALRAARGSRFWPAISAGAATSGEAHVSFAMTFDGLIRNADNGQTSASDHLFGAETSPAATGC